MTDYIRIDKKQINSALNCEAYSSFEIASSDHRIDTAKICLSLRRNTIKRAQTTHYDWSSLNNRDICNKDTMIGRNEFDTLMVISETLIPNDEYVHAQAAE